MRWHYLPLPHSYICIRIPNGAIRPKNLWFALNLVLPVTGAVFFLSLILLSILSCSCLIRSRNSGSHLEKIKRHDLRHKKLKSLWCDDELWHQSITDFIFLCFGWRLRCWCPCALHHQVISSHGIDWLYRTSLCLPCGKISAICIISVLYT